MAKRGRPTNTNAMIKKFSKPQFEPKQPIAGNFFLPNHSGDHSKGRALTTPTTDYEIVNKKYVDDNAGKWEEESGTSIKLKSPYLFAKATYFGSNNYNDSAGNNLLNNDGTTLSCTKSFDVANDLTVDTTTLVVDSTNQRVSIGTAVPYAKFHVVDTGTGLKFPIKLANRNPLNTGDVGILFQTDIDSFDNRGKGAIVYEATTTWNRGDFHILQNSVANSSNPTISDAKLTVTNGGNVGIANITPTLPLDVNAKSGMSAIGGICIKLTNTTGANTVQGQLVKADTATNDAVVITAGDDIECFGVFLESGIADDAEAWVVVSGIADVAMEDNTTATRGNWVRTSITEAGYADATNNNAPQPINQTHFAEIGHCIETVTATGEGTHVLARCVLHFN